MSKWGEIAQRTLDNIPQDDYSESAFLARGAALAILQHEGATAKSTASSYARAIDELEAAEQYASEGNDDFAADELRHAEYWTARLNRDALTDADKCQVQDLYTMSRRIEQKIHQQENA